MRDYVWPRCPSGWNGEERQFFRALIELLQEMGRPIEEKDLSDKLKKKIEFIGQVEPPEEPEEPEAPFVEVYDLFDEGYVNDIGWTGNVLPRPQYTGAGSYMLEYVQNGFMQVGINVTTNQVPIYHNAHLITSADVKIPEGATKMCVECLRYDTEMYSTHPIYMQFGVLPSNAPGAFDASSGGQLSQQYSVSDERKVYEMPLNVTGNFRAIINARGETGTTSDGKSIPARRIRVYKVWFE